VSTPAAAVLAALVGACAGVGAVRYAHRLAVSAVDTAEGPPPHTSWRRTLATAALGALLSAGVVIARHPTVDRVLGVALVAVLVIASATDLATRRIPNRLTGPAALLAILLGAVLHPSGVGGQLIASVAAGGFLLIFAVVRSTGLGMGDVKLAAVLGLYLGGAVTVALFAGLLAAGIGGLGVIARLGVGRGRRTAIPLGPFLALGGIVAVLCGHPLLHWYTHTAIH
jgi:leader peptidase (prepilin peptidase) / N-methyltransferase